MHGVIDRYGDRYFIRLNTAFPGSRDLKKSRKKSRLNELTKADADPQYSPERNEVAGQKERIIGGPARPFTVYCN